jgi:hypothetical protein
MRQYAVCRTVAEYKGYEFHIPRSFPGLPHVGPMTERFGVTVPQKGREG